MECGFRVDRVAEDVLARSQRALERRGDEGGGMTSRTSGSPRHTAGTGGHPWPRPRGLGPKR